MCRCEKGFRAAECTQRQLPPVFEAIEHALDNVSGFAEIRVVFELHLAVFAGWDAGHSAGFGKPVAQMICVIATICDDSASFLHIRFKALTCLCNISPVTCREMQVNRAPLTVADKVQLAVQPAFCAADGPPAAVVFLTPLAAIRWVLTWLASIISVSGSAPPRARASKIRSKTPASDQRL